MLKAQLIKPHLFLHSAVRSPFLFSHSLSQQPAILCYPNCNQTKKSKKKKECIKRRIRIWFSLFPFLSQTVTKFNSRKGFSKLTHLLPHPPIKSPKHTSFLINILIHSHHFVFFTFQN